MLQPRLEIMHGYLNVYENWTTLPVPLASDRASLIVIGESEGQWRVHGKLQYRLKTNIHGPILSLRLLVSIESFWGQFDYAKP